MSFVAHPARRPSAALGRRWSGVAMVALLALALAAAAQDGPAPADATRGSRTTASGGELAPSAAPVVAAGRASADVAAPVPATPAGPHPAASGADTAEVTGPDRGRAPMSRSEPIRLRIPAIGVDSELVGLGLQEDGRMQVPDGAFPAGWFTGAPTPGELGPAVLAGHVDHGGAAGVFVRLRELRPGDAVDVARADGSTARFRVTRVEQHAKDAFPTAAVYGDIDHAGLRLITCGGTFDRDADGYRDNVVVFAELGATGPT